MWAGSLSHNGLTGCGSDGDDFATHKLEHELGGMFDVAHGAGLAAVWGSWARYVVDELPLRFERFAVKVMGVEPRASIRETALAGIAEMEDFFRFMGMPTNLRELGVGPTEEQIATLARMCAEGVGGRMGAAKRLDEQDMLSIYRAAL